MLMHLAATVPVKPDMPLNRPCVVGAGGREPIQWEADPHHQFINTNAGLRCSDNGGGWKSRTVPLGDGDEKDKQENLCVDVVKKEIRHAAIPRGKKAVETYALPRCMDMITAQEIGRRIEAIFHWRCHLLPDPATSAGGAPRLK